MGKGEEEQVGVPADENGGAGDRNVGNGRRCSCGYFKYCIGKVVGVRCVLVLLLSAAVFLSAIFWLPPFLQFSDQGDLDLDSRFRDHDIVASFNVRKPVSFMEDNILKLVDDIYDEMSIPNTKVVILSLEPFAGSNTTMVVFGVDPDAKYSKLSSTDQSLVKSSFEFLVVNQSLRLTKSLFGDSFSFEVLKFPGGITIIPPQAAFLLQRVHIPFNFTLNFSIYQIRENFAELTSQLKAGLHLTPRENLYMSLSNSKGSTIAPPTTIQAYVLLAIGSMPRVKQLAQTITGHSRNLGLNNTVFGKVKQVRLSSILQHSLHGGEGSATSPSPAPVPGPHPSNHHHHHHYHHHHHHHHDAGLAPSVSPGGGSHPPIAGSPAPLRSAPAPQNSNEAKPPGCQRGPRKRYTGNGRKQSHVSPSIAPDISPHFSAAPSHPHVNPPRVPPRPSVISHGVPVSTPLPHVALAHAQPPSKRQSEENSDTAPTVSPSPSTSSSSVGLPAAQWVFSLPLVLVLQL